LTGKGAAACATVSGPAAWTASEKVIAFFDKLMK
jgi:hypothetical protein